MEYIRVRSSDNRKQIIKLKEKVIRPLIEEKNKQGGRCNALATA